MTKKKRGGVFGINHLLRIKDRLMLTQPDISSKPSIPVFTQETIRSNISKYLNGNPDRLPNIGMWVVTDVTDMSELFVYTDFNEDISHWDVSNVTNMRHMFTGCSFNHPLNWNLPKVTDLYGMFHGCSSLNQSIDFDTPNVTNMSYMFHGCASLNKPITLNTTKVTDMSSMFMGCASLDQPIALDTPNVTNMNSMFHGCASLNKPITLNTTKVTDMSSMFMGCASLDQPIILKETLEVTDMSYMFYGCTKFNDGLVMNISYQSSVRYMNNMFQGSGFDQDISEWNIDKSTVVANMFDECPIRKEYQPKDHLPIDVHATNDTINDLVNTYLYDSGRVKLNSGLPPINSWDVSEVTDMSYLFLGRDLFNENISRWNTANVTNMSAMFKRCNKFNRSLPWMTANVTDMSSMFDRCSVFNQNLSGWDTGKVTNMENMFRGCSKLYQQLSEWNTNNVINMKNMFLDTAMPGIYKPHLPKIAMPPERGFDIILYVLLHGATTISCPSKSSPNIANVTLLEGSPCGVSYFCDTIVDPIKVILYVNEFKYRKDFVVELQSELRNIRKTPAKNPEVLADPEYHIFKEQEGWRLITGNYMERSYTPDEDATSKIDRIVVCDDTKGLYSIGENLAKSFNISSRTDLMHLLKDSGYGRPLIIDFSCGGFEEFMDPEKRKEVRLRAQKEGVAGGKTRKRKMKSKTRRKNTRKKHRY